MGGLRPWASWGTVGKLVSSTAAVVAAAATVTLAATYVAGTESTAQVASDAAVYGAAESLLAGATATHARVSEAILATAALPDGEVDEDRVGAAQAALDETGRRSAALAAELGVSSLPVAAGFHSATRPVIDSLERGEVPSQLALEELADSYDDLVAEVVVVRREAAAAISTARSQAGALTTAARLFVVIVVPVLAMTGIYRSLRGRQRRRELELNLASERRLRQEKDRLIATVGHELRTPLTGVLGLAETLREGRRSFSSGERNRMIETVADQANELSNRIDDLITVSRVDTELLVSTIERVDVRPILEKVTSGWEARHSTRLTVTGRGAVRADPHHVEHVLRNLLTCATLSGGDETEVRVHPGNMFLSIEVRDDGGSIAESSDQAEEGNTAPSSGLGLGMVAARRLTEHMGGTLERFRADGVNVSILRLPLAPVGADEEEPTGDLILDPRRTRPTRRDVQRALSESRPIMVYEPIVSLLPTEYGVVVGYEALARFPFGKPESWFKEAADLDLGVDLELAAIEEAVAGFQFLDDDLFLAVNVSDDALMSAGLLPALRGIDPLRVVLELSEDAAIASYDATSQTVEVLQKLGYRLALDDVGQGETDLWHVMRMRPAIVKLDVSIVQDLHRLDELRAVVAGIVTFGDRLGVKIIAEGIERRAEVGMLRELGVTLGQGFLFAGAPVDGVRSGWRSVTTRAPEGPSSEVSRKRKSS